MFLSFSHHRFCVVFRNLARGRTKLVYGLFNQNLKDKVSRQGTLFDNALEATGGIPDPLLCQTSLIFSTRIKAENFFITNGPGEINFYVLFTIPFHQVPDSLLIFRLFSVDVWISILITLITVAFAYAFLLTMIDDFEARCKCDG